MDNGTDFAVSYICSRSFCFDDGISAPGLVRICLAAPFTAVCRPADDRKEHAEFIGRNVVGTGGNADGQTDRYTDAFAFAFADTDAFAFADAGNRLSGTRRDGEPLFMANPRLGRTYI